MSALPCFTVAAGLAAGENEVPPRTLPGESVPRAELAAGFEGGERGGEPVTAELPAPRVLGLREAKR